MKYRRKLYRNEDGEELVDEPTSYLMTLNGDTEVCEAFKVWLATTVLPEIRKSGFYMHTGGPLPVPMSLFRSAMNELKKKKD